MTMVTGDPFEHLVDAAALLSRTGHPAEALPFLVDRVRAVPWDFAAKLEYAKLLESTGRDRDEGIRILRSIAESNDAPYDTRVSAAKLLAGVKAAALTTASTELNLLSSIAPIAPASAEKSYFYHARIRAAEEIGDVAAKIRLLEGAAAIDPNAAQPKLALFDAAYGAKRYQTAVAAFYPFERLSGVNIPQEQPDQAAGQFGENPYEGMYWAERFIGPFANVDAARREKIAREIADSYAKLNMLNEAAFYSRIAVQLDPASAEAKTQLASIQSQLGRRRANRQRQPTITANLEQDHPVRPRLAAASGAQGGGQ